MKPRKPLPRPTKPLARSTKRIERKPITRKPLKRTRLSKKTMTKRRKAINAFLNEAKDHYFSLDFGNYGARKFYPCQRCRLPVERKGCHAHHKIKRSLWATASVEERERIGDQHGKKNLVIICEPCHDWAHDESRPENLKSIRTCTANAENGEKIQ